MHIASFALHLLTVNPPDGIDPELRGRMLAMEKALVAAMDAIHEMQKLARGDGAASPPDAPP